MKIKCPNCKTEITEKGSIFCPECGNSLTSNPPRFEMETKEAVIIIVLLVLLFPLGIIYGVLTLFNMSRERKEWMHEQDMKRLESK